MRNLTLPAVSVTISVTLTATKPNTTMSLQQAFEQYPEVYAEIFKLGVTMERTLGFTSDMMKEVK